MHRIFISSVQKELAAERRALKEFIHGDALLRRYFDVFLFEDLPASDRRADEVYLAQVDASAIYLGIFGAEYGSQDNAGLSPTEREFLRATEQGKERLVFVVGAADAHLHDKMRTLINRAGSEVIRRRVSNIPELTAAVYASLVDYLEKHHELRTLPFDASACRDATLADISEERVRWFLAQARQRQFALTDSTPIPDVLTHLDLLEHGTPTNAAILLFGRTPQRFLVASEVKCLHFHGVEVQKPIPSYQVYQGTAFQLVDQAVDFVMSKVARLVGTRAQGPQAPVEYELPRDAVAEAIVNAVAHRDYTSNASIQVMLFSDRLEVWNPGQLPPSLTPYRLTRPHSSIPHNPFLAKPLFLARYIEGAGTGTLDMIAQSRKAGLNPPQFRQDGGQFVQTLWRPAPEVTPTVTPEVGSHGKGPSTPQVAPEVTPEVTPEVARLLRNIVGSMSRQELQDALSLRDDEHFRLAYLQPAIAGGVLEMTIPDKPTSRLQKYRLTVKGQTWLAAQPRKKTK